MGVKRAFLAQMLRCVDEPLLFQERLTPPSPLVRSGGAVASVACSSALESHLDNTEVTESVAEGCVGVLLFPAALLLPQPSNTVTIRDRRADLEFWNFTARRDRNAGVVWSVRSF